ncbi:hypothetical protein DGG96_16765 [Legionella qingyii]|uniref:Uncharacterized protein n=1 Tax=Legionella qingyii TaxID=2184757 RepID=A0A317U108_9GAMM|nr:hypothetical protein DGG96_16765 [Legionella qingyii]
MDFVVNFQSVAHGPLTTTFFVTFAILAFESRTPPSEVFATNVGVKKDLAFSYEKNVVVIIRRNEKEQVISSAM